MHEDKSLAEQDVRVARLGEVSLRMMAGTVGGETLTTIRQRVAEDPAVYPWEDVVRIVVAEPIDPSELVNRALVAQRDWLATGAVAAAPAVVQAPVAAPAPAPAPVEAPRPAPVRVAEAAPRQRPRSAGYHVKKFIAVLIVKGLFYGIALLVMLVILVLLERRDPDYNVYAIARSAQDWLESLVGG